MRVRAVDPTACKVTQLSQLRTGQPRPRPGSSRPLADGAANAIIGLTYKPSCKDEARIGQKGRTCHRWYQRGVRPPGPADQRFESLYLFAACRPGTDQAFALALPEATTGTMNIFLAGFAARLAPGTPAVLILDQAGWHGGGKLVVPENVTLVSLPPYSPELNPVERVWLYLRERFLSHRVLADYGAVLDAACRAWTRLVAEPGRLASLTAYSYRLRSELLGAGMRHVTRQARRPFLARGAGLA